MRKTLPLFAESAKNSFSLKRILVFGGHGFIGRNLQEQLRSKYDLILPTHKEIDIEKLTHLSNSIDTIINLVNAEDNLAVYQNITRFYFGRLITIGSGAEYDHSLPIKNVREDFDRRPKDNYGLGKYFISRQAEWRLDTIVLRPFGVFGKYEDINRRFISKAILDHNKGLPITIYRDCKFSYVWVEDLVRIIEYFIEHKPKHKFYNVGGHKITLKNIAKMIGKYKVLEGKMGHEYTCDDSRVRNETGIIYTPFKESLKKLKEYYEFGV